MLLFLTLPKSVSAQVVINEINPSGEWVELYKTSQGLLSLENCTIYFQDSKSQKKVLTQSDNFLENELYKVILTGASYLNNTSSDTVSLECSNFVLDPISYPDNVGDKSYARIPNMSGSFIVTTQITQGTQNPDPTPEPTQTPSPTQTPTTAPTQASTAVPTASPTLKPSPTKSPSPKPTVSPSPTEESEETNKPTISISDINVIEATPTGLVAGTTTTNKKPIIAFIFIFTGVLFLGYGGYLLYNMNSKNNDKRDEYTKNKDI